MSRQSKGSGSWLDVVAGLLHQGGKTPARSVRRRLTAEVLEGRSMLSVAPMVDAVNLEGQTLNDYLAQNHQMGPIAPTGGGYVAIITGQEGTPVAVAPGNADLLFGAGQGEGEGEGSGSSAGSGSGANAGSGSGAGTSSGSGSSAGSGSGSGSSSGEGQPGVSTENQYEESDGTITASGIITDDGDSSSLTVSITSGSGTITIHEDGSFELTGGVPNEEGYIEITVTDANGNSTVYAITV
jgi:hypothetical protein